MSINAIHIGTTHSIVKSLSGSKYSRVGMVVELPNKYTQKNKLYILEVSRNIENFLDAFYVSYSNAQYNLIILT